MSLALPIKSLSSRQLFDFIIIGSPILSLMAVAIICEPRFISGDILFNPRTPEWLGYAAMLLTQAHILLIFLRSHGNQDVFRRFPVRFKVIPFLLIFSMWVSPTFFGVMGFVALYWDEWHSIMQTFGFGRIYDAKLGNDPLIGRKLDMGMAFVTGLLPHVILLLSVPESLQVKALITSLDLREVTARNYGSYIMAMRWPLITFGVVYLVYYFQQYRKLIRSGYRYSKAKFALFASTGVSAVIMACFYTIADSRYFGNFYHAIQYFFIIYISEGALISKSFKLKEENRIGKVLIYIFVFLALAFMFAYIKIKTVDKFTLLASLWLSTSLLHFWYDGFIWSVRKKEI